jgi:hypothetical protein
MGSKYMVVVAQLLDLLVEPSKIRALPSRMVGNWEMCIVQSRGFHEKGACQG